MKNMNKMNKIIEDYKEKRGVWSDSNEKREKAAKKSEDGTGLPADDPTTKSTTTTSTMQ